MVSLSPSINCTVLLPLTCRSSAALVLSDLRGVSHAAFRSPLRHVLLRPQPQDLLRECSQANGRLGESLVALDGNGNVQRPTVDVTETGPDMNQAAGCNAVMYQQ